MLINVCIIQAGSVVGSISQKYFKSFISCSTPEGIACLDFKWCKSKFQGTFNELLKIAEIHINFIEMKQEVWWVQSLMKVWVDNYYFIKHKNDMHVLAVHQKLYSQAFWFLNYQKIMI